MDAKSFIFLSASAVIIALGCAWVWGAAWRKDACIFMLVLGTVHSGFIDINLMSREWYRGTTRGIEWCWLDYLWVFVLVDELKRRRSSALPVCLAPMLVFIGYNALRVVTSDPWIFGLFELVVIVSVGLGSLLAPVAIELLGSRGALIAAGGLLAVLSPLAHRPLGRIDDGHLELLG